MLAACATAGGAARSPLDDPGGGNALSPDEWVDFTIDRLDLRARVAQLVMVWMSGGYASATDEEMVRIEGLVADHGIGGIVISLGTPHAYVSRLNRLQTLTEVPLLVAADFEWGVGYRVGRIYALPSGMDMGGATRLPPAMAFGAAGDVGAAYEAGRITGIEARALGVHLSFAPVLDVNNNPENPVINTRSFGEDPAVVAELGAAYIRGARDAGLMTTAKHFPGHGDTATDSHEALPVIPGDRERLDAIELVPFRRAIEAGVDAVMTAHVAAPAILGAGAPPATLSPYFMTELLRGDLGFDGVLITDALDMGAIVDGYGPGEAAVRALEAGADILLMPTDPPAAIDAVVAAVEDGRITAGRVEESVRRVLSMKAAAGLHEGREVDPGRVTDVVGTEAHMSFADSVARRSITLVRDMEGRVPFDTLETRRVLSVSLAAAGDVVAGRAFDGRLGEALEVMRARLGTHDAESVYERLLGRALEADHVVVSLYATPVAPDDAADLPLDVFLARLALAGVPATVLSFTTPYLLTTVDAPPAYLVAWGADPSAQRAAADALLGRYRIGGRLPVSLPPIDRAGEGLRRDGVWTPKRDTSTTRDALVADPTDVGMDGDALALVDRIIERAIADSVTPGAAIAVGRHGRLVRSRGYGALDYVAGSPAVSDSSLYDLASLTKVVATTTALMTLVDDGEIGLDDTVGRWLPEWSEGWKEVVTVRDLLLHRSGLPPFRPFWRELSGRDEIRRAIGDLPLEYEPGTRTVYSDIGLVALQFVIETATGEPLDVFVGRRVFGPLGMSSTGYLPSAEHRVRVAPTEVDTVYRHRHVVGEVHDENAHALGGVAGHAGLFSTAADLARFGGWILDAARAGRGLGPETPAPEGLPRPATVAAFTARADSSSSRALGWDTPSGRSSAGRFFTAGSFGHTGFTGTSIWVDPERDVFVVLLTNRVNPTRGERGHIPLRRAVHDAVAAAIRDLPVDLRDAPAESMESGERR